MSDTQHQYTDPQTNPQTNPMTIGDLSEITGLSPSAIRFYQRRGLLPAREAGTGWQRFDDDALNRLAVIELAKSAGFNLDEVIRVLDALDADPDTAPAEQPIWQGLAKAKIVDIDTRIERLRQMRQLLSDAVHCSYLSPDRAAQVPAVLGWTAGYPHDTEPRPGTMRIPSASRDMDPSSHG